MMGYAVVSITSNEDSSGHQNASLNNTSTHTRIGTSKVYDTSPSLASESVSVNGRYMDQKICANSSSENKDDRNFGKSTESKNKALIAEMRVTLSTDVQK